MHRQTILIEPLRKRADFVRLNRFATKVHQSAFILQLLPKNSYERVRIGFTASKKVGNACIRNKAKRRFREILRSELAFFSKELVGYDLVLIAKPHAVTIKYATLCANFHFAMKKGLKRIKEQGE